MENFIQRVTSIFLYTFPLKESLPFGYYLFNKFAFLKILFIITLPITIIEQSFPFGSLLIFLLLFFGLIRNMKVPYFIRFNAFQVLLLKIVLIIITYVFFIFKLTELGFVVFTFSLAIFFFSIIQCALGKEPEIPLISKSVRMQI